MQGQRNTTWMVNFKNGKNQACQIQLISLGLFKGPNPKALTVKLGKKNIIVYDYIVDTI